jgi:putative ABC transport system substrate-binding protein
MRRREFIFVAGGALLAGLSRQAPAQQPAVPVIGFLGRLGGGQEPFADGFRRGLKETGFVEGQNVLIDARSPEGHQSLKEVTAAMVKKRVAAIFCGNNVGTLEAKAATSEIPIVFVVGIDPVQMGLVSSINRPGGNATGVAFQVSALEPKRFDLVRQLLPRLALVGVLTNPDNPNFSDHLKGLQAAADPSGLQMLILQVRNFADIEAAFETLVQRRTDALLVTSDPLFNVNRPALVALAERKAIPTMYPWRDFVDAGGLMSYGNSLSDAFRQGGVYVGRILKGDKPADLPIWKPTKFEFVINLKTARKLGLEIPPTLLAFADQVIE